MTKEVRDARKTTTKRRQPSALGALTLMALRRLPYREVEAQIRYYARARYLCGLTKTDGTLVPQIRYWLRTGFVAAGKIINLHIPETLFGRPR